MKLVKEKITDNLEVNVKLAEDQEEYNTLYANSNKGIVSFAFELDEEDLKQINESKRIYVSQCTFNKNFQPINVQVNPEIFEKAVDMNVKDFGSTRSFKEGNYYKHAQREFEALYAQWAKEAAERGEVIDDFEMDTYMNNQILELLEVLDSHGHSGSSIHMALNRFRALALFRPLSPLTGAEEEWAEWQDWNKDGEGPTQIVRQNLRFSSVFQEADENGKILSTHQNSYYVFCEKNGSCWNTGAGRKEITFPYMPPTKSIEISVDGDISKLENSYLLELIELYESEQKNKKV